MLSSSTCASSSNTNKNPSVDMSQAAIRNNEESEPGTATTSPSSVVASNNPTASAAAAPSAAATTTTNTNCPTCSSSNAVGNSNPTQPSTTQPVPSQTEPPVSAQHTQQQQQQHYPQQQPPPSHYHGTTAAIPPYNHYPYPQQEEDGVVVPLAAAVTVGSLLGLTAAAAVRWLNGGDFNLLPPAVPTQRSLSEEPMMAVNNDNDDKTEATTMVQTLVRTVQQQSDTQERLLEELQHVLSRKEQQEADPSTLLQSIYQELVQIRQQQQYSNGDSQLKARIESTLDKLDVALQQPTVRSSSTTHDDETIAPATKQQQTSVAFNNISILEEDETEDGDFSAALATTLPDINKPTLLGSALPLRDAIVQLVQNDMGALRMGTQLLYLYVVNVSNFPRVPRYRKIFTCNDSFQKHILPLKGATELLQCVGFVQQPQSSSTTSDNQNGDNKAATTTYWEWLPPSVHSDDNDPLKPSPQKPWFGDSEEMYLQRLKEATEALSILKSDMVTTKTRDELISLALSAAGLTDSEDPSPMTNGATVPACDATAKTPPRSNTRNGATTNQHHDPSSLSELPSGDNSKATSGSTTATVATTPSPEDPVQFQTPDAGSILSPPATKKQSSLDSLPPVAFPTLVDNDEQQQYPGTATGDDLDPPNNLEKDANTAKKPVTEEETAGSSDDSNPLSLGEQVEAARWSSPMFE